MSIATDVSRIKGNITAALAAIADKGVTVPDGSTSDALASLIASIEAGGGGNIATITFTPASKGGLKIPFEKDGDVILIVCFRNSFIYGTDDTGYGDQNEVPVACTLVGLYANGGKQYPFHLYNSSSSGFSSAVYKAGSYSVNNIVGADSTNTMLVRYDLNAPILSVYVNTEGSKGLRIGETYTAICFFRS